MTARPATVSEPHPGRPPDAVYGRIRSAPSRSSLAAIQARRCRRCTVETVITVDEAAELAGKKLAETLPRRWRHVRSVADALASPASRVGPLRRSNFNKMAAWPQAVRAIGAEGLHLHDLRHTGNHFAAASGARLRDLMARMGHDSERCDHLPARGARG